MEIPDYISPFVGHRVWRWDVPGLHSLNGEPWLPDRPAMARCRVLSGRTIRHAGRMDGPDELPDRNCTCGVYAAENIEHLRQLRKTPSRERPYTIARQDELSFRSYDYCGFLRESEITIRLEEDSVRPHRVPSHAAAASSSI